MKPQSRFVVSLLLVLAFGLANVLAKSTGACSVATEAFQQGPSRGSITVPRDPELEKQSYKSLDAAKFYFYKRKPNKNDKDAIARLNKAILDRLQEIVDLNPNFARIDEVYFLLGEVHHRGGDTDEAVENWKKAIAETSDEKIKSDAQKRLDEAEAQNKQKKG